MTAPAPWLCLAIGILLGGLLDTSQAQQSVPNRGLELAQAALERTFHQVDYDGSYRRIPYPLGDVPDDVGVCTDVIVRSYRVLGVDLQQLVHEDMKGDFAAYPAQWGLRRPDTNIDHRRVPNIRRFLERQGASLIITMDAKDYLPGDLVTYNLLGGPQGTGNLPHIGIVSAILSDDSEPLLVHNIGGGPRIEDMLFDHPITGHYRYLPAD